MNRFIFRVALSSRALPGDLKGYRRVRALHSGAAALLLAVLWLVPVQATPPVAGKVTAGQRAAALEFLSAVASGDPQAVASAIHPDDLQALRLRILGLLREEAKRGDSTIRSRLFGPGMPLEEGGSDGWLSASCGRCAT